MPKRFKILLLLSIFASPALHAKALSDAQLIQRLIQHRDHAGDINTPEYQGMRREIIAELLRKPKAFLEPADPDFHWGTLCRFNLAGYYPDHTAREHVNESGGWYGHCVMDTKRINRSVLAAELMLAPKGADEDYYIWQKALKHYEIGARAKDSYGMLALAYYYGRDARIGQDLSTSRAADWLKSSASFGNGDGLAGLAYYYEFGLGGVNKNPEHALKLNKMAIDVNGAWLATIRLGPLYESMTGMPGNRKQALLWYAILAKSGMRGHDYAIKRRDAWSFRVTAAELKQVKAEVAAYFDAHPERWSPLPPVPPSDED
jgi:TPR repeat protein